MVSFGSALEMAEEASVGGPSDRQKQREKSKLNFAKGTQRDSILGKGTARRSMAERRRSTANRSSTASQPADLMEVSSADVASAGTSAADGAGEGGAAAPDHTPDAPPPLLARPVIISSILFNIE